MAGLLQTLCDCGRPVVEALREPLMEMALAIVDFEGELANEPSRRRIPTHEIAAVDIENGEDALDGAGNFFEDGIGGHGNEEARVVVGGER